MRGYTVAREMPKGVISMAITKEDFEDYLEVQKSGMYNMMSPDAITATGLDKETYMSILSDYSELKERFG